MPALTAAPGRLSAFVEGLFCETTRALQQRGRDVREAIVSAFEATPGDPRFCVRRLEVVEHAARALGIRVRNNALFAEVNEAAVALGFEPIRSNGRSLFRCAKRRDLDEAGALAVSRANRFDARTGHGRALGAEDAAAHVTG
jgi:hypothetical protein